MSGELGLRHGTLRLVPHRAGWTAAFAVEEARLSAALPQGTEIHHIGSTALRRLAAKPILDIAAELAGDWPAAVAAAADTLVALGYRDMGGRSGRLFIRLKNGDVRTHALHVYATGDARLAAQKAYRDRLRAEPTLRDADAMEKAAIIARDTTRQDYAAAKGDFMARALR